jgi:hypothetical protein
MKIILSRKGFDTASGGAPSPIFPDGRMLLLPIPDKQSSIKCESISWHDQNLGKIVSTLTKGKIRADYNAHLDPDLNPLSLPRNKGWKPLLGQTASAQGHLRNSGVTKGDVFLFFGLFRDIENKNDSFVWKRGSLKKHVIWGWMKIGDIIHIEGQLQKIPQWAHYHPHLHGNRGQNNTLYIAKESGIFAHYSDRLQLTITGSPSPSIWEVPNWMFPGKGRSPLSFHADDARWKRTSSILKLNVASRGQEFVLNASEYPESGEWLQGIIDGV